MQNNLLAGTLFMAVLLIAYPALMLAAMLPRKFATRYDAACER